jgi:hypothetical protein
VSSQAPRAPEFAEQENLIGAKTSHRRDLRGRRRDMPYRPWIGKWHSIETAAFEKRALKVQWPTWAQARRWRTSMADVQFPTILVIDRLR